MRNGQQQIYNDIIKNGCSTNSVVNPTSSEMVLYRINAEFHFYIRTS
jgi:hypothetical protein